VNGLSIRPARLSASCICLLYLSHRPDAVSVVRELQSRGVQVLLVSGDSPAAVAACAREAGIPVRLADSHGANYLHSMCLLVQRHCFAAAVSAEAATEHVCTVSRPAAPSRYCNLPRLLSVLLTTPSLQGSSSPASGSSLAALQVSIA